MLGFDLSTKLWLSVMHYPSCQNLGRLNRKLSEVLRNLKSLDIFQDALHSKSLMKKNFSNDTSVFIPESYVSDTPIRHERPRMTTNTSTVPLGMIPIPLW